MECCEIQSEIQSETRRGSHKRPWRSAGSCIGSGTMLLLLPKCPICIAAYLGLFTGLGVATSVAGHLRFAVAGIFLASLVWLLLRLTRRRMPDAVLRTNTMCQADSRLQPRTTLVGWYISRHIETDELDECVGDFA